MLFSYRNQSIDLYSKSIDWFLYEGSTGIQWVKSNEQWIFSYKTASIFQRKRQYIFWRGVESKTIFKTQVFFKKILFTETNDFYIGHLRSLFFCVCCTDEAFFDRFSWLHNEHKCLSLVYTKDDESKDRLCNLLQIQNWLDNQTCIGNMVVICVDNMIKDNLGLFLFWKMWKYPSTGTKEENYLGRCTVRILCIPVRPWDSSRNREPHGKTEKLGRSEFRNSNLIVLLKIQSALKPHPKAKVHKNYRLYFLVSLDLTFVEFLKSSAVGLKVFKICSK